MGVQNELEDIAYDSIPILLLTIISTLLRDFFASLHQISLSDLIHFGVEHLIFLAEKIHLNITVCSNSNEGCFDQCVVCLCEMRKRERLRKLECGHVFHSKCLDGWFKLLHFTCPLCRSLVLLPSTVSDSKLEKSSSFGRELVSWFGVRR